MRVQPKKKLEPKKSQVLKLKGKENIILIYYLERNILY